MKFRAHDTFFIRKGWLSKGMRHVKKSADVFVSCEENPMDVLGLGANMVKALRYWLQAVGLTYEPTTGKRIQSFTELGELIYKYDPYCEERGTLWFLQYRLASNIDLATAWYFFFNEFSMQEFTRDNFVTALKNYIDMQEGATEIATRSLEEDFNCIVGTYLPRHRDDDKKISPENNIFCPFSELGLIDILNKRQKIFRKSIPSAVSLNPWIVLAIIVDNAKGRKEMTLTELLRSPKNIGRVFNLDSITMLDALYNIERLHLLKISRTAGLDVISIRQELTFLQCVENFYRSIDEQEIS